MTQLLDRLTAALADRYRLDRELGRGGMSTVYLALDVKHHRQVAIKVLHPDSAAVLGPERFLREIEIAARFHHPNILPVLSSGQADDFIYYVMPFIEGGTLRERLSREGSLPLTQSLRIAAQVADALGYLHSNNLAHRDVKPENIMLHANRALLTDFGLIQAISESGSDRLTTSGALAVGTPQYMSPEQMSGSGEVDGRADEYSLGCVLYEMLSGARRSWQERSSRC